MLQSIHPAGVLAALGIGGGLADALAASWRYVFYLNVPIGLALLGIGWAATAGWETPRREHRLDLGGATAVSVGLAALLLGITVAGGEPVPGCRSTRPSSRGSSWPLPPARSSVPW